AAADDGVVDAEAAQDLRHLGEVAELVGEVADLQGAAKGGGDAVADQQAAEGRLAAGEELVVQLVPGADGDPAGAVVFFEPGAEGRESKAVRGGGAVHLRGEERCWLAWAARCYAGHLAGVGTECLPC